MSTTDVPFTVLIVDDDDDVRNIVAMMASKLGYAVLQAIGAPEALRLLRGPTGIALLLTDLSMPHLNGMELAHLAVGIRPGLKVAYMSAYVRGLAGSPALRYGPLLTKPFGIDELKVTLAALIGGPNA